jgi:peroxiredoxin
MIRWAASLLVLTTCLTTLRAGDPAPRVAPGQPAPAFTIKDPSGKTIDLAQLTAKGPVLVRLTCGCAGCDKELAYFQQINDAYKANGLTSLFIFKEPADKIAQYAADRKLNMLYAVDTKGASWDIFQTKTMPTNILIEKGGKIAAVAAGCDPSGLLANRVSEKVANAAGTTAVDVKNRVEAKNKKP